MIVVAADLVAEPRPDPAGVADDDRGAVLDGQQRDRLVGRGGPAEEVDEQPALAGVLVGQEREDAARPEDLEHLVVAPRSWGSSSARSARGSERRNRSR